MSSKNGCLDAFITSLEAILHELLSQATSLRARHHRVQEDHHPAPGVMSKSSVVSRASTPSEIEMAFDPIPWFFPSGASHHTSAGH